MKQKLIITLILGLMIAAGVSIWVYNKGVERPTNRAGGQTTKKTSGQETSPTNATTPTKSAESNPINEADQNKQSDSTSAEAVGNINISVAQDIGETVVIRTTITGIKSGTCQLSLTNGQKAITKSAPLTLVTSYYTCQGFNIAQAELSPGTWTVIVKLADISSKKVDIIVK